MIEVAIAIGVFVLALMAMIPVLRCLKSRPSKGRGGFSMALMMILASVLDPAKAAAIEQLDKQKETEGSEEGESGAGLD